MMNVTRKAFVAAGFSFALVLTGCVGVDETGEPNISRATGAQIMGALKAGRAAGKGKPPVITPSRKQLENTKVPALQINPEARGGSDFLRLIARRNDDQPGTVAVWRASDNAQVFLRNGVLVGSRGIGSDIISSDAGATVQAVSAARGGNGERRYFISDGGYGATELVLSCDIENLGRTTTQVVHLSYATTHLRETCVGGAGDRVRIVNEYWVQPANGIVRRSKQWAGPLSGYFEMIVLKN